MSYTNQGPWTNNVGPAFTGQKATAMDTGIKYVDTWVEYLRRTMVFLDEFSGSGSSGQMRTACSTVAGWSIKPAIVLAPGITLDAGTTPFALPAGINFFGTPGNETEFGYTCPINIRHTGISGTNAGVFKQLDSNAKGWSFNGISFQGTSSTRAFQDSPFDTSGAYWKYVTFNDVSFNGFESIYQGPLLGFTWTGQCYLNNFSCTREPLYWTGSDNNIFTDGAFMECGNLGTYSQAATLSAMIRMGSLAKTRIGQIYVTGSPTTPFRLDGGEGGISLADCTVEGRPVPGGGPRFLWCAGELVRLTGGSMVARNKWWGFAMRDPGATGRSPGGFIHITGGDHVIDGGTFQPYTAATYGGTVPPFIYITGGHVRVTNITQGTNTGGVKPIVKYASASMVDADSSVTTSII